MDKSNDLVAAMIAAIEQSTGRKFEEQDVSDFDIKAERKREAKLASLEIEKQKKEAKQHHINEIYQSRMIARDVTFESLGMGDEYCKDAIDIARSFCNVSVGSRAARLLLLSGGIGSGKTTLCHAIANEWMEKISGSVFKCRFKDILEHTYFVSDEPYARSSERENYWQDLAKYDLLIIDGIAEDHAGLTLHAQELLCVLLDDRRQFKKSMVVTSPVEANLIEACLGDRVYAAMTSYNVTLATLFGNSRRKKIPINQEFTA